MNKHTIAELEDMYDKMLDEYSKIFFTKNIDQLTASQVNALIDTKAYLLEDETFNEKIRMMIEINAGWV